MVALDSRTGALTTPWPRVLSGRMTGQEYFFAMAKSSIPDGEGGCYVGGSFQTVSGVARSRLVHIRADGSLDGWAPAPNATVNCFARIGPTLFVGGFFSSTNGQPRAGLAALDMTTGALLPWDAHVRSEQCHHACGRRESPDVSGYFSLDRTDSQWARGAGSREWSRRAMEPESECRSELARDRPWRHLCRGLFQWRSAVNHGVAWPRSMRSLDWRRVGTRAPIRGACSAWRLRAPRIRC